MAKKKGGRKISSIRETSPGFGFLERITIGGVIRLIFLVMMIFVLISFMGLFAAVFFGALPTGNIAVIPITGTITSGSGGGFSTLASSSQIVEWIKNAD